MEDIIKSERLDDILRRIGSALWVLQKLESQAAIYYLIRIKAKTGMGFEKGTELLIKHNKKTFGTTLRALGSSDVLPKDLQDKLKNILFERNWLAHESSVQGYVAIDTEIGTIEFVQRIENIKFEGLSLMKSLLELTTDHVEGLGLTQEKINRGLQMAQEIWFDKEII